MSEIVRRLAWDHQQLSDAEHALSYEWLVANGLGGSASGTVAGVATRRFHGLLVAALPAPLGRIVMLNHLAETLTLADGRRVLLGATEPADGPPDLRGLAHLAEFALELGLPVWRYEVDGYQIEKRLIVPHRQNTVHLTYRLLAGPGPVTLELRPSFHFRPHEGRVDQLIPEPYRVTAVGNRYEIGGPPDLPPARLMLHGAPGRLTLDGGSTVNLRYRVEDERGYDARGPVWSPGYFSVALIPTQLRNDNEEATSPPAPLRRGEGSRDDALSAGKGSRHDVLGAGERRGDAGLPLSAPERGSGGEVAPGQSVTLIASAEPWETILALTPDEATGAEHERRFHLLHLAPPSSRSGPAAELLLAADQFIITPVGRADDLTRAQASGDEVRTVIAGYHWFTDWGRDTMISLEGLTLATGRHAEAGSILRMFARHVRDGLIPNMFPEGENQGLYHTADATLWFFHALDRYLKATDDRATLQLLLPTLRDIVDHHLRGTSFGIGVDPADGLLRQGAEGYQLTWMDAKVDDWVVTPRRGKAVEINALWYNALTLLAGWLAESGDAAAADDLTVRAAQTRESFNRRFWLVEGGHLYDIVDGEHGDDPACRPNQVFAISLPHPILDQERWQAVLNVVREQLLTPVGLRSLAPGHPDYKPHYFGDLRARDAAYHQGTAWGWLAGPYVDAYLKVYPDDLSGARQALAGFEAHLGEACLGTISEVFDAEAPYTPRGCVAQAWSVAEVLRVLTTLALPLPESGASGPVAQTASARADLRPPLPPMPSR